MIVIHYLTGIYFSLSVFILLIYLILYIKGYELDDFLNLDYKQKDELGGLIIIGLMPYLNLFIILLILGYYFWKYCEKIHNKKREERYKNNKINYD